MITTFNGERPCKGNAVLICKAAWETTVELYSMSYPALFKVQ